MKKEKKIRFLFWALMFCGAFLVLSRRGYSDGDDVYFYQYAHEMGFLEYLKFRYTTWVGRLSGEAMVYITFRLGLTFWRGVNALMLVLLPMGILRLARVAAREPEGTLCDWRSRRTEQAENDCRSRESEKMENGWRNRKTACGVADGRAEGLGAAVISVAGYLLMNAMTLGYAAVWVNGSIFYTWSFVFGIWALVPIAELVFFGRTDWKNFLYGIPCAVIASMSIEQMGAVLAVFEVLAVLYCFFRKKQRSWPAVFQTVITIAAVLLLLTAPGNDIRVETETATWLPEYASMSFGQHLFITVQWLLSSFANENKLFLAAIWVAGIFLLLQKKERSRHDSLLAVVAGVFTVAALFPYIGITIFSDMGMHILDITARIDAVLSVTELTGANAAALCWWMAALIFTFIFLWKVSGFQVVILLAYLAGIASEAIMFFSPTMYASGARVYYLTDLLYLFIILALSFAIRQRKSQRIYYGIVAVLGVINFISQISVFRMY